MDGCWAPNVEPIGSLEVPLMELVKVAGAGAGTGSVGCCMMSAAAIAKC